MLRHLLTITLLGSSLAPSLSLAALQLEQTPPSEQNADCGQKTKITLDAATEDAKSKDRAVAGMVKLGQLPADKVQEPLEKPKAAKAMETCK